MKTYRASSGSLTTTWVTPTARDSTRHQQCATAHRTVMWCFLSLLLFAGSILPASASRGLRGQVPVQGISGSAKQVQGRDRTIPMLQHRRSRSSLSKDHAHTLEKQLWEEQRQDSMHISNDGANGTPVAKRSSLSRSLQATRSTKFTGDVAILVYVVGFCGRQPAATVPEVQGVVNQLQGFYRKCSNGQASIADSSAVISLTMPCSGPKAAGGTWTTNTCAGGNMYDWMTWADQQAVAAGFNLVNYSHRIMILPRSHNTIMSGCRWSAISTDGMLDFSSGAPADSRGYGLVWVGGDSVADVNVWVHELGHNMGLEHAGTRTCAYCDYTCAMSTPNPTSASRDVLQPRCFNAPHTYQLGWAMPRDDLVQEDIPAGSFVSLVVPSQAAPKLGFTRVAFDEVNVFWISYRVQSAPFDMPYFDGDDSASILIHIWNDDDTTTLLARLRSVNDRYRHSATGFTVVFDGRTGAIEASVSVCRGQCSSADVGENPNIGLVALHPPPPPPPSGLVTGGVVDQPVVDEPLPTLGDGTVLLAQNGGSSPRSRPRPRSAAPPARIA